MPASLKAKAPSIADYGRNRPTVKIGGFGRYRDAEEGNRQLPVNPLKLVTDAANPVCLL